MLPAVFVLYVRVAEILLPSLRVGFIRNQLQLVLFTSSVLYDVLGPFLPCFIRCWREILQSHSRSITSLWGACSRCPPKYWGGLHSSDDLRFIGETIWLWVVFTHRCMVSTSSHMFILSMMPLCHAWQTKIKIRFILVLMKCFSATVAISYVYPLFRKWRSVPYLVWDLLYQHSAIILDINYLLAFLYLWIGWETRSRALRLWRFISILLNLSPTN